jgi:hypothetical protein
VLIAYQNAINSREYHTFSAKFLIDQNTVTIITLDQGDQVVAALESVLTEVEEIGNEQEEVKDHLKEIFR